MGLFDWLRTRTRAEPPARPVELQPGDTPRGPTPSRRESRSHLLLLSKFLGSNEAKYFDQDYWSRALGESGATAIEGLRTEGLLVEASLQETLLAGRQAKELKELARSRGLKVSGRRSNLPRG